MVFFAGQAAAGLPDTAKYQEAQLTLI